MTASRRIGEEAGNELRAANDRLRASNHALNVRATSAEGALKMLRTVARATVERLDASGVRLHALHELRTLTADIPRPDTADNSPPPEPA